MYHSVSALDMGVDEHERRRKMYQMDSLDVGMKQSHLLDQFKDNMRGLPRRLK